MNAYVNVNAPVNRFIKCRIAGLCSMLILINNNNNTQICTCQCSVDFFEQKEFKKTSIQLNLKPRKFVGDLKFSILKSLKVYRLFTYFCNISMTFGFQHGLTRQFLFFVFSLFHSGVVHQMSSFRCDIGAFDTFVIM